MKVRVRVRDYTVHIDVGPGHQRLKWLAMVALQRYHEDNVRIDPGSFLLSQVSAECLEHRLRLLRHTGERYAAGECGNWSDGR